MNETSYAQYAWMTNGKGQLCPCQACVNDRLYYGPLASYSEQEQVQAAWKLLQDTPSYVEQQAAAFVAEQ